MTQTQARMLVAAGAAAASAALVGRWAQRTRGRLAERPWRGRVALITGGSRGLGLALARELAKDGMVVCLLAREADALGRAVASLTSEGAQAHAHIADVRVAETVERVVSEIASRHGRLDVLINNAGIMSAMPFDHATESDFEDSLRTHFWGPLHCIRAALPWLRQAHPGHIVNVSSIGGRVGVPHLAPYCAGKFALTGLSDVLRPELARDDVRVTTVTPGLMRTGSVGHARVRGHHLAEARWFAAMAATPLTSIAAQRAARDIVAAMKAGRASVVPGWQARLLRTGAALAPELVASLLEMATALVLPAPTATPTASRAIASLDLGWSRPLLSPTLESAYNQRPD